MQALATKQSSGWLAFELSVLKRLEFKSVSMPFSGRSDLGNYLKHLGVRVVSNDPLESAYLDAVAWTGNNGVVLEEDELDLILEDAYVPQYKLKNPALLNWFSETDAWWFDNVRTNIERLSAPISRAVAISLGMKVGDYVLSFDEDTRVYRQPLSKVFRRFYDLREKPVNNGQNNQCYNLDVNEFTAVYYTDLFFLRLPAAQGLSLRESLGTAAWREEWVRCGEEFWDEFELEMRGRLGSHVETKSQYLELLKQMLETATNIPLWAIEHVENGFVPTQDIVETLRQIRKVDTVFTKDFSELTGTKGVLITA